MKVDVPLGDVVDRVTIDRIKEARIGDAQRLLHVRNELSALVGAWAEAGLPEMTTLDDYDALARVNQQLWDVEDGLRELEAQQDFGSRFVELARSVYKLNDRRAALKRAINLALGSELVEVKSYAGSA